MVNDVVRYAFVPTTTASSAATASARSASSMDST